MNIISCFDGMSCGQIALNRLGIKYDNYYASEIDKYAIKVTQANYPNTVQLGSIENWQDWDLSGVDLIMAGSPCQGFSVAGKRLNFDDPRSKLFFIFEKVLKHYQPKWWLLENVVMLQEWQDIISQRMGRRPIRINSALVSAQSRERLYWTNIENKLDMFGMPYCNIPQPRDRHIYLKDIIKDGFVDRDKSLAVLADTGGGSLDKYFNWTRMQLVFNQPVLIGKMNDSQDGKIVSTQGKSFTLSAGHNNYPKVFITHENMSKQKTSHFNKSCALRANASSNYQMVNDWRKLTPLECERLQTVSDNYTNHVSNTQRYKMLGNGWTIDVITHILQYIMKGS